jgi:ADP-ribose pyrophosphatase
MDNPHGNLSGGAQMDVVVHSVERVFDGFFKIDRATFSYTSLTDPERRFSRVTREILERGNSVAALIHVTTTDEILLIEQLRIQTYLTTRSSTTELAAGKVEDLEAVEVALRREVLEETGYQLNQIESIANFYLSPGTSSERLALFYAPVQASDLVDPQASGVRAEQESIRRFLITRTEFISMAFAGRILDAKTLVAAFWLAGRFGRGG